MSRHIDIILTQMKLLSAEILSTIMGLWLLWIIITYANYFRKLKSAKKLSLEKPLEEEFLQNARKKRRETYDKAVTYPSYLIFWTAVILWGLSYLLKNSANQLRTIFLINKIKTGQKSYSKIELKFFRFAFIFCIGTQVFSACASFSHISTDKPWWYAAGEMERSKGIDIQLE